MFSLFAKIKSNIQKSVKTPEKNQKDLRLNLEKKVQEGADKVVTEYKDALRILAEHDRS